jgi:hypothetical protein
LIVFNVLIIPSLFELLKSESTKQCQRSKEKNIVLCKFSDSKNLLDFLPRDGIKIPNGLQYFELYNSPVSPHINSKTGT